MRLAGRARLLRRPNLWAGEDGVSRGRLPSRLMVLTGAQFVQFLTSKKCLPTRYPFRYEWGPATTFSPFFMRNSSCWRVGPRNLAFLTLLAVITLIGSLAPVAGATKFWTGAS